MYFYFDPMYTAVNILTESENASLSEQRKIQTVLEDAESPVTNKYLEKLYDFFSCSKHQHVQIVIYLSFICQCLRK